MSDKPIGRQWLHSCYVDKLPDKTDAVVISELVHYADGTVVPELRVVPRPKRSFEKKEMEDLEKLDKFTVYNYELEREVFKALNGYYTNRSHIDLKELCASPYLYGADTHIETLIKASAKKAFDKSGCTPVAPTTGFYDIERSMLKGNAAEITIISRTHENEVYTAILRQAFFTIDAHGNHHPGNLSELEALSHAILDPMIEKALQDKGLKRHQGTIFKFHYYIGETELDLIKWIFAGMHKNKTSLVGIWNLDYDISVTLDVLKKAEVNPTDIFCPPELAEKYRKVRYVYDNKKVQHHTDKWHWLYNTSYSQFFDAMALYAKLRTVIGKETSYALDDVLEKNGLGGKLHFRDLPDMDDLSKIDWHRRMQARYPLHYIVYNQWDVVSLQLNEWKNSDAQSMLLLSEYTTLAKFTKQTRKVADTLYVDWIEKGRVLGTTSNDMKSPYDADIGAIGGAVLSPLRLDYNGLNALTEAPHHKTQLHPFVNDVDFTGMYPTVGQACNISKDTKLSTMLYITGEQVQKYHTPKTAVEVFFGYVINPDDNAMALATEFFGLPDYETMLESFEQKLRR